MSNKKESWYLYACCIPVMGNRRSIICDIQREKYFLIPNSLYHLVNKGNFDFENLYNKVSIDNQSTIQEYFDFLISNEIIFKTNNPNLFPPISLEWKVPFSVTNAIIDMQMEIEENLWYKLVNELSVLNCKHIQIRFFYDITYEKLNKLLSVFLKTNVGSIELILPYCEWVEKVELNGFFDANKRIFYVTFFGCPTEKDVFEVKYMHKTYFITEVLTSHLHCGVIHPTLYNNNIQMFTESLHHNSCLNRKISIDAEGNLKNCPSMTQSFGNIRDTTLQQALDHPDFKKYWNITKDQIEVCKDCEFRYICTDCRAYTENPEDLYAKPLKCGYNPYTCEWEEWSTNPLKQQAIDHYGMREVLPEFKLKPDYVPPTRTPTPTG